jgi:hypothetical protein
MVRVDVIATDSEDRFVKTLATARASDPRNARGGVTDTGAVPLADFPPGSYLLRIESQAAGAKGPVSREVALSSRASVPSQKFVVAPRAAISPAGKARGASISRICDRRATQSAGMQHRPNANELLTPDTRFAVTVVR